MSVSLLGLGLGFLHGFDAHHLAAVAALAAGVGGLRRVTLYAVGHAVAVLGVGACALGFGFSLPGGWDRVLAWFVGGSLAALGIVSLARAVRPGAPRPPGTGPGWAQQFVRARGLNASVGALAVGGVHGLAAWTPTQLAALVLALTPAAGVAVWVAFSAGVLAANLLVGCAAARRVDAAGAGVRRAVAAGAGAFALGVGVLVLAGAGG